MGGVDDAGLLIIDKPAGLTSHQVVGRVRRVFGTRKVGHAGTLDPMATGVLIIGLNRATRLLGHLALHDKSYLATIRLGQATNTDDAEGEVTGGADASGVTDEQIEATLAGLRGEIMQVPSTVSAIKVDGKRAYARARAGEQVELAARRVTVSSLDVLQTRREGALVDLDVEVCCSSGTYVRALARDLGASLGVGGHLTSLRRTRIGRYTLDQAVNLDELTPMTPMLTMAHAAGLSMPVVTVDHAAALDVGFGRSLPITLPAEVTGIVGPDGDLLALYRPEGEVARPIAVLVG